MKKFLMALTLIFGLSLGTFSSANADTLDYDAVIYGKATDKEMYSISKTTFFVSYSKENLKDLNYSHMKLSNGKIFSQTQFFITVSQAFAQEKSYEDAMKALDAKADKKFTNIVAGKVANNGTIINKNAVDTTTKPEPEVKEFKVVDIK